MGDPSTHAVFYQGYWHLCYANDRSKQWIESNTNEPLCGFVHTEKEVELK